MGRGHLRGSGRERSDSRRRFWLVLLAALLAAAGIRFFDVEPAVAQTPVLTAWHSDVDPGLDPDNVVWDEVPSFLVQLTGQSVTPPMSDSSASWIAASALHHNDVLYINLQWVDVTDDRTTDAVGVFADAIAVQFPAVAASSVPAICMGQADAAVNIWHWRADSQEGVSAVPDRGYVDMYPEVGELYYPAAAASNPMVSAPAVQNLVAGGFGTLSALDDQTIAGGGSYGDLGWAVTMARPFTPPGELQPEFEVGGVIDIAFAVWNGANDDRNGQKSVSTFVRMVIEGDSYQPVAAGTESANSQIPIVIMIVVVVAIVVIAGFVATRRSSGDEHDEAAA